MHKSGRQAELIWSWIRTQIVTMNRLNENLIHFFFTSHKADWNGQD